VTPPAPETELLGEIATELVSRGLRDHQPVIYRLGNDLLELYLREKYPQRQPLPFELIS
jgi:hypothetical protein